MQSFFKVLQQFLYVWMDVRLLRMRELYERARRRVQEASPGTRDDLTLPADLSISEGNGENEVQ
ncbi:hypothetical protein QN224_23905 [Sinorhizobium sp. 8-89]|uniref:hypothetical protein n=1 Tax=Sinorhizobium sp. 7-81 TaxID=3049087 RepID=UPI0024C2A475|nr:hypothetical protein [Sinorhizobium sp. 7-81]MDK1388457.1 hypothetical protein [Sinorhizobium sp. 7-81]